MGKHISLQGSALIKRRGKVILFILLICMLIQLACSLPGSFQRRVLKTPLSFLFTDTPGPSPEATSTPIIPVVATPKTLEEERFRIRGAIQYERNTAHPEQDCFWLGLGGQVLDVLGAPLEKYVVVVEGTLRDEPVEAIGLTGTTDAYGENSYELVITYLPVNTAQSLSVTLYDINGVQLSNPVRFNTYADCTRNLIKVTFEQIP